METKLLEELLCVLFGQGYTLKDALALIATTGVLALARQMVAQNKVTAENKGLRYLLGKNS